MEQNGNLSDAVRQQLIGVFYVCVFRPPRCWVIREVSSFFPFSLSLLFFLNIQQALLKGKPERNLFWEWVNWADCQAHLSESRCTLSEPTSCSCQCRTCHIIEPNRLNISLPSSQFNPSPPPTDPPPGWFLSCFQTYGCPGQFVSPSTAVSSTGHSVCSAENIQHPWDSHVSLHVLLCARLWIRVCDCGGLKQQVVPCSVDSVHRALRAVNNRVSAKGSPTQTGRCRQSLSQPAHIKSTYRTGHRGRWTWQSSSQSGEA